jgi:prepilin peptidase CpaA
MHGGIAISGLLAVLALLLLAAAVTDLRSRTIGNSLTGAVALLALPYWWASGIAPWPGMAIQLGLGAAVFAFFALSFRLGMMGGGDVKLLAALALWLPVETLVPMLMVMALIGGVVTVAVIVGRRLRRIGPDSEVPYGLAITLAGLWAVYERYLNQFA